MFHKADILERIDLEKLIQQFYDKLLIDELMQPLFADVINKLQHHLSVIVDFWENILFQTGSYTGNTMLVHLDLHLKYGLKEVHFNRWLFLFQETVNELFEGDNAQQVLKSATSIAIIIKTKVNRMDGQL